MEGMGDPDVGVVSESVKIAHEAVHAYVSGEPGVSLPGRSPRRSKKEHAEIFVLSVAPFGYLSGTEGATISLTASTPRQIPTG